MKIKNQITSVIFDFDGTIIDTNQIILESWRHTFKELKGVEMDEAMVLASFGEPLDLSIKRFFPDISEETAMEVYRSFQHTHYDELIRIFPGMDELIRTLKEKGYKLGIVTSRATRTTLQGLEKYGIKEYFDTIITWDHTPIHKPNPEPLNLALKTMGSKPEEAIMVGDSHFDIGCAANGGVPSVLVGWAMSLSVAPEDLGTPGNPDYCIEEAMDLLKILEP